MQYISNLDTRLVSRKQQDNENIIIIIKFITVLVNKLAICLFWGPILIIYYIINVKGKLFEDYKKFRKKFIFCNIQRFTTVKYPICSTIYFFQKCPGRIRIWPVPYMIDPYRNSESRIRIRKIYLKSTTLFGTLGISRHNCS